MRKSLLQCSHILYFKEFPGLRLCSTADWLWRYCSTSSCKVREAEPFAISLLWLYNLLKFSVQVLLLESGHAAPFGHTIISVYFWNWELNT